MSHPSLGPRLRSHFGRYEKPLTEIYRRIYMSLDAFAEAVGSRIKAVRILEVGCGEGMLTERLHRIYPSALIIGTDISSRVGRLFPKTSGEVLFLNRTAQAIENQYKNFFDLIVLCDVLHHVPRPKIPALLGSVGQMLMPGGTIVIKDWQKKRNLIYLLGYLSDRFITGDHVFYLRTEDWEKLLGGIFGKKAIKENFFIPPWSNNIAFVIRPEGMENT
jgi:2-polyprenyl-3-methyl-5-hydroxy-6-metoxy-1,4-benzoquinol methylase